MKERLDLGSRGNRISVFHSQTLPLVGIYVEDGDCPAVFYADKCQVRQIIDILEKLSGDA